MLGWIGLALLAASWLFGLEYYHRPEPRTWMLLVGLGTTSAGDTSGATPFASSCPGCAAPGDTCSRLLAKRDANPGRAAVDRAGAESGAVIGWLARHDRAATCQRNDAGRLRPGRPIVRVGSLPDVHGPIP